MQLFYDDLRMDVETVLCSPPVDDSPTMAVSPTKMIREDWHDQILSALQMIRDERDDAVNDATVEVDEVLDKILDNAIEAYGSAARDVYAAIFAPSLAEKEITDAMTGMNYEALRDAFLRLQQVDSGIDDRTIWYRIFSMKVMVDPGRAHLTVGSPSFKVQFRSRWVQTRVSSHLNFLEDLDTATIIKEMNALVRYF
jgi:hypothetical protein